MQIVAVFVCLLVAVAAKPQLGGFGFHGLGGATGGANSGSFQGQSSNLFGNTQLQNSFANAGVSMLPGAANFKAYFFTMCFCRALIFCFVDQAPL